MCQERKKMNNKLKYILISVLCISVIANMWLFFSIGYLEIDWQHEYDQNYIEWCELSNDYISFINDLVIELQYYNHEYEEIELLESMDCWYRDTLMEVSE